MASCAVVRCRQQLQFASERSHQQIIHIFATKLTSDIYDLQRSYYAPFSRSPPFTQVHNLKTITESSAEAPTTTVTTTTVAPVVATTPPFTATPKPNNVMADLDSYAFQPGQQVQCKTRFDDVYKGEVVAFDLSSKILILKSPAASGISTNHDLNFLVLDSVSDVQILEEPAAGAAGASDQLPNIEMKHIKAKQQTALADRMLLIDAVGNGVSREGIQLYSALSKKYDRASDIVWKDKVKIVVMNAVVINPPYTEADCHPLSPKIQKEAVSYVKSNVKKFWESNSKQQQQQQQASQQQLQAAAPQAQA